MNAPKQFHAVRDIYGYDENNRHVRLHNFDTYKGIYAIGLDPPKNEEATTVMAKIGLGGLTQRHEGGLISRIRSYYTCFPDGVWEYCFLVTKNKMPPKGFLGKIEREVHAELDKRNKRYSSPCTREYCKKDPEWFKCTIRQIRMVFLIVMKRYPDDLYFVAPSEKEEDNCFHIL